MPGTAAAEADFPAPTAQADSGKAYLVRPRPPPAPCPRPGSPPLGEGRVHARSQGLASGCPVVEDGGPEHLREHLHGVLRGVLVGLGLPVPLLRAADSGWRWPPPSGRPGGECRRRGRGLTAVLQEKHKINNMLETLLTAMIKTKPERPIQFLIDSLTFDDPDDAIQDSATGLNRYRLKKLTEVFRNMDKDESGNIDFTEMKAYGSKFGLAALSEEELKDIFREFDASGDHKVSLGEFVLFFSRTLKEVEQEEFDNTIKSMLV